MPIGKYKVKPGPGYVPGTKDKMDKGVKVPGTKDKNEIRVPTWYKRRTTRQA
jgi:hypothetical protein